MRRFQIVSATPVCVAALLFTFMFAGPTAASGASRPTSVLPSGFLAQSQSLISPKDGWLLGLAPCGQKTCTTVAGTTDGGSTWSTLGRLKAPLGFDKGGVTEVRFADALHGWAIDPGFWATNDGGTTWTKQTPPGGGGVVAALGGDADAVYALVSPCRYGHQCTKRPALWSTTVSGGSWTQVALKLPRTNAAAAVLKVDGVVAYLVVPIEGPGPDIFEATTDAQTWSSRPDPCVKSNDEQLTDVAPSTGTNVALLCVANGPQPGQATKRVLRSTDSGQTTTPAGSTPISGTSAQLAAAPNGTLAVSCFSGASYIYRNSGGTAWATVDSQPDGGQGWNDITFTTNKIGWVIYSPSVTPHHLGLLVGTTNGGLTWAQV